MADKLFGRILNVLGKYRLSNARFLLVERW